MLLDDEGWDLDLLLNKNSVFQRLRKRRHYSLRKLRRLRRLRRLRLMSINLYLHRSNNRGKTQPHKGADQDYQGRNHSKLNKCVPATLVGMATLHPYGRRGSRRVGGSTATMPLTNLRPGVAALPSVGGRRHQPAKATQSSTGYPEKDAPQPKLGLAKQTATRSYAESQLRRASQGGSGPVLGPLTGGRVNDNKLNFIVNLIGDNLSYSNPDSKVAEQRLNKKNISEIFLEHARYDSQPIELAPLELCTGPAWDLIPVKLKENSSPALHFRDRVRAVQETQTEGRLTSSAHNSTRPTT